MQVFILFFRVLYNRRSKFDPLWLTLVVGGDQVNHNNVVVGIQKTSHETCLGCLGCMTPDGRNW